MSAARRRAVGLLLAAMVVLAGCAAGAGGDEADGREGAEAPTASAATLPPGVTEDGLKNLSALLAAHRGALVEEGFVVVRRTRTTHTDGRANSTVRERSRGAPGLDAVRVRARTWREGRGERRYDIWTNGTVGVRRQIADGDVEYTPHPLTPDPELATETKQLRSYLEHGDFGLAGVERRAGRVVAVLTTDTYVPGDGGREGNVTAGGRLVVDSRGRIHEAEFTVVRRRRDPPTNRTVVTRRTVTYRIVEVGGVTVEPPEWLGEAREEGVLRHG